MDGSSVIQAERPPGAALEALLQAVLAGIEGAKALIQSVMEEIRVKREEASSQSGAGR